MRLRQGWCVALLLGLAGVLLEPGQLRAKADVSDQAPSTGRTLVLVAGAGTFQDSAIKARPGAEKDAKTFYSLLTDGKHLKVAPADAKLLAGTGQATRAAFLEGLAWLTKEAQPGDTVIVGLFAQGGPQSDGGDRRCYFLADSQFATRDRSAVAESEIADALKNLKSQRVAVFLDVNFKGYTAPGKGIAEPTLGQTPYREFLGDDGTEDHNPLTGHVVFLATTGLQPSLVLPSGEGIFTKVITDGLSGKADTEGGEPDGRVTVDELTEYIDKQLPEMARQLGKNKEEKQQLPFVLGGRANHYPLTMNPPAAEKAAAELVKFEALVKDGKIPEKFQAEGRNLLNAMPKLEVQRSLRKQYQALAGMGDLAAFEAKRDELMASTKLAPEAAADFAKIVRKAIDMLQREYVKELKPGQMAAWAVQGLYRRIEEKIPESIATLLLKPEAITGEAINKLLGDARMNLGRREDLDKGKDVDITLQRMMANLDPYTTYLDSDTKATLDKEIQGNFTGIGVQIRRDSVSDMLLVVTPIKDSPAFKAGIQAGDLISKIVLDVDNKGNKLPSPEVVLTKGLAVNDAVKKILGKPGTPVTVFIQREGQETDKEIKLIRQRIEVESVLGYKRKPDATWNWFVDPKSKIGYIRLTSFSRNSARDMMRAVDEMRKQGMKGLVFDLRFNPGGLLDSAVLISDMFVDDGLIVSIRPRGRQETQFSGSSENSLTDFPMVVMVNSGSASGSEIVSAALQDHHRAYVIGERSFGKGSVQNIKEFGDGEIKLTTATFWRPSGKNLNKSSTGGKDEDTWGVKPDLDVKLTRKERDDLFENLRDFEIIEGPGGKKKKKDEEDKPPFVDTQLQAALTYLRGQMRVSSR